LPTSFEIPHPSGGGFLFAYAKQGFNAVAKSIIAKRQLVFQQRQRTPTVHAPHAGMETIEMQINLGSGFEQTHMSLGGGFIWAGINGAHRVVRGTEMQGCGAGEAQAGATGTLKLYLPHIGAEPVGLWSGVKCEQVCDRGSVAAHLRR